MSAHATYTRARTLPAGAQGLVPASYVRVEESAGPSSAEGSTRSRRSTSKQVCACVCEKSRCMPACVSM